jgi:DNA-binding CsgD family transcriptional regulator
MAKMLSNHHHTWLSYLDALKDNTGEEEELHLTGFDHFLNANNFANSFFRHSIPFVYLLDYRRSRYLHMSENFGGYRSKDFLEKGISHTLEIYQQDHLQLFDQEIFPRRLEILKHLPPEDFKCYAFSYNLCIRNRNGKCENFLQRNCFVPDEFGNPVFSMGILINVNHQDYGSRVIQTVDKIDVNGLKDCQNVHREIYFLNEEDKLFSKREKEVLVWMADGLSSKMIADKLNISEHTVVNHRRSMQEKSNMPNATALVSFAIRSAII